MCCKRVGHDWATNSCKTELIRDEGFYRNYVEADRQIWNLILLNCWFYTNLLSGKWAKYDFYGTDLRKENTTLSPDCCPLHGSMNSTLRGPCPAENTSASRCSPNMIKRERPRRLLDSSQTLQGRSGRETPGTSHCLSNTFAECHFFFSPTLPFPLLNFHTVSVLWSSPDILTTTEKATAGSCISLSCSSSLQTFKATRKAWREGERKKKTFLRAGRSALPPRFWQQRHLFCVM